MEKCHQKMQKVTPFIMLTCPCNVHPITPHFYIVKLGFTGVYIISSPEPLGSQGELIVYPSSRRPFVVRLSVVVNNFKHLLLQNRWADQSQILCGASLGRGNDILFAAQMTKMAATPIYGKTPSKIFFSRTGWPIFTKLGM